MKINMFQNCPRQIIISLNQPRHLANIARKINSTHGNVSKIVKGLEDINIIKKLPSSTKRIKSVDLTPKGKKIRELLIKLEEVIKE